MYIELIIIFNIYIDFLLLLMTAIIIKKKVSIKRLILSSFVGGISTIVLFLKISILELLIISFIFSLIITYMTFKSIKGLFYFYLNSITLGGFIFLINNYFKITNSLNYLILIIILPILVIIYKKKVRNLKENYNYNFQVKIKYQNQKVILNSFLDTGNNLTDPYFHKPVILINEYLIKSDKYFYIPYNTITEEGIIKAFCIDEVEIIGFKSIKNVVIGLLPKKLELNNIDCLLNKKIMEEIYV